MQHQQRIVIIKLRILCTAIAIIYFADSYKEFKLGFAEGFNSFSKKTSIQQPIRKSITKEINVLLLVNRYDL